MTNRGLVIELVNRLPEDAPLVDILKRIEYLALAQRKIDGALSDGAISIRQAEHWLTDALTEAVALPNVVQL